IELPQGAVSVAVLPKDSAEDPAALVVTADAGKNAEALADVMARATKAGEEAGGKLAKEEIKGLTVVTITPPKPKEEKEGRRPASPVTWTHDGGLFYIGTDLEAVKDLVTHSSGRDDSLAGSDAFIQAQKKLGPENAQIIWYADLNRLIALVAQQ